MPGRTEPGVWGAGVAGRVVVRFGRTARVCTVACGTGWTVDWLDVLGWVGSREALHVALVRPELVVEVGVDVARDSVGRWRHPARWHRPRPDLTTADVPRFTGGR
jgi:hypothetical protein